MRIQVYIIDSEIYNKHIKPNHINLSYSRWEFSCWMGCEEIKYVFKDKTEIDACRKLKCVAPRDFFKGLLFKGDKKLQSWKRYLDNRGLLDSRGRDELQQNEAIRHLFQLLYKEDINNLVQDSSEFLEFIQRPETVDKVLNKLYNSIGLLSDEEIRRKVITYLQKVGTIELDKRTSAVLVKLYLHHNEVLFFKKVLSEIRPEDIKENYINLGYSAWGLLGWIIHMGIKCRGMTLDMNKPNTVKIFERHKCEAPKGFFIGVQLPEFKAYLNKRGLTYAAKQSSSCLLF